MAKRGELLKTPIPCPRLFRLGRAQTWVFERDTAAHCETDAESHYCRPLTITGVSSERTELCALLNSARCRIKEAVRGVKTAIPYHCA